MGFQPLQRGSELRFTLLRDPYWRLSACTDGPSGRDVDCRVHVRVRLMSAGDTPEDRLALAVVRCAMPAGAAGLRRIGRVDLLDSSRGFMLQSAYERTPAVGQDAPIQTGFCAASVRQVHALSLWIWLGLGAPCHPGNVKVFNANDVEPSRQRRADLLDPVLAAIAGARVELGDGDLHLLTTVGTALTASHAALQAFEPCLFTFREPGARPQFASGQCGRDSEAAVQANDFACTWRRDGLWNDCKRDVPAAYPVTSDAIRPRFRNRTRQSHSYPADLRDVDRCPPPVHLHDPRGLRSDYAESFMQAGFAPRRPPVDPGVEVSDGLVKIPQRLLLHGLRPCSQPTERGSRLGQLPCLPDVTRRRALVPGPHIPLLERQVPYVSSVSAMLQQPTLLCDRRIHAKPGHTGYLISQHRQSSITERKQPRPRPRSEEFGVPRSGRRLGRVSAG
jgi:hypothetical protein